MLSYLFFSVRFNRELKEATEIRRHRVFTPSRLRDLIPPSPQVWIGRASIYIAAEQRPTCLRPPAPSALHRQAFDSFDFAPTHVDHRQGKFDFELIHLDLICFLCFLDEINPISFHSVMILISILPIQYSLYSSVSSNLLISILPILMLF